MSETFTFQAETQQLLNILVHSLYTQQEIFLRELLSNASDALNRVQFEQLTNDTVIDADSELSVEIKLDEEAKTLTISDTGIGMNQEEMVENLGTIARSGAKAFIEAMQQNGESSASASDIIGQFGVGFYSVFMVADKVEVISRSYRPEDSAYKWISDGSTTYTIEPAEKENRGTDIIVHLKDDMDQFLREWTIKDIVRRHSNYVTFPVYVGDDENPTNAQKALWRQNSSEIEEQEYNDFYKMLTMDFTDPLHRQHIRAEAPMQFYALLFIPSNNEPNMLSPRKEPGLKLYARKVLIEEYSKDLLPEYLQFIQGVVDSEDLPLSVSREGVQATRIVANLKKTITTKVLSELKRMARKKTDKYIQIYEQFARFIKQGLVVSMEDKEDIEQLLLFHSSYDNDPKNYHSLNDYVERMADGQEDIYYVIADDFNGASRSPHLDAFKQRNIEVLYFDDPVDAIMLMGLTEYKEHTIRSVDDADIDLDNIGEVQEDSTPQKESLDEPALETLHGRFKKVLGGRISDIRDSKSLVGSPARLISEGNNPQRYMYRMNRLLDKDTELPVKILEINPRHPLIHNLSNMMNQADNQPMVDVVIEQVFETALLQDGIHPDPASMAKRLHILMQAATGSGANDLDLSGVAPVIQEDEPVAEVTDESTDTDSDETVIEFD